MSEVNLAELDGAEVLDWLEDLLQRARDLLHRHPGKPQPQLSYYFLAIVPRVEANEHILEALWKEADLEESLPWKPRCLEVRKWTFDSDFEQCREQLIDALVVLIECAEDFYFPPEDDGTPGDWPEWADYSELYRKIITVIAESDVGLSGPEVVQHMEKRGWITSLESIKDPLSKLKKRGVLKGRHGPGYSILRLPARTPGSVRNAWCLRGRRDEA